MYIRRSSFDQVTILSTPTSTRDQTLSIEVGCRHGETLAYPELSIAFTHVLEDFSDLLAASCVREVVHCDPLSIMLPAFPNSPQVEIRDAAQVATVLGDESHLVT